MERDPVKIPKSRFEPTGEIPSENERKLSAFAPYGMAMIFVFKRRAEEFLERTPQPI
jgi:hypothetical protein